MSGNINIINIEELKLSLNPMNWWNRFRFKKESIRILFIDDKDMPVVSNLKAAGWSIEKLSDVKNIDDERIKRNHIIFIDYKGVGKNISPKYEGVGLAAQIKKAYQGKKRVIIYSANTSFSRDAILDADFNLIDNKILKNADTTEFIDMITNEMRKLG